MFPTPVLTDLLASTTAWTTGVFYYMSPVMWITLGIGVAAVAVMFVPRKVLGAVKSVLGKRKGRKGRRGR